MQSTPFYTLSREVHLIVRRKNDTFYLRTSERSDVLEIKKMIAGITGTAPEDQELYYGDKLMIDARKMRYFSFTPKKNPPVSPAILTLCYRGNTS